MLKPSLVNVILLSATIFACLHSIIVAGGIAGLVEVLDVAVGRGLAGSAVWSAAHLALLDVLRRHAFLERMGLLAHAPGIPAHVHVHRVLDTCLRSSPLSRQANNGRLRAIRGAVRSRRCTSFRHQCSQVRKRQRNSTRAEQNADFRRIPGTEAFAPRALIARRVNSSSRNDPELAAARSSDRAIGNSGQRAAHRTPRQDDAAHAPSREAARREGARATCPVQTRSGNALREVDFALDARAHREPAGAGLCGTCSRSAPACAPARRSARSRIAS